jgi:hypothetical protein
VGHAAGGLCHSSFITSLNDILGIALQIFFLVQAEEFMLWGMQDVALSSKSCHST